MVGGNAGSGASAAASGTKWNFFGFAYRPGLSLASENATLVESVMECLTKEDGRKITRSEATQLLAELERFMGDCEPEKAKNVRILIEKFPNIVRTSEHLYALGYTRESVDWFLHQYTKEMNKIARLETFYTQIGEDTDLVGAEYIGKDFQLPNYIYDRTSIQSKQHSEIYGWKCIDDVYIAINKNGNIFLDNQNKPVIWESDILDHPSEAKDLQNKIDFAVNQLSYPSKFGHIREQNKEEFAAGVEKYLQIYPDPMDYVAMGRAARGAKAVLKFATKISRAREFEYSIYDKIASDRVARIRDKIPELLKENGWKEYKGAYAPKDRKVYTDDKYLYTFDTQHGRIEKFNKRGEHLGEFDIDMNQTKPPDKSGKHNLRKS